MTLQTASHFAQLLDPAAAETVVVPERIQLIPPGTFFGRDGRGPYRIGDMAALITASQSDGPLIIDEGHATDQGEASAPAFGRITSLEADETGLWGMVRWNTRGKTALQELEYWGISPVFEHTPDGTVVRLLRASLTNIPNLRLGALNSQQEPTMTLLEQLRALLGLDATADDAKVVAHAKTLLARDKAAAEAHAALCTALKLDPTSADPAAVLTAVQSAQAAAPATAELQASCDALKREVAILKASNAAAQAETAVDAAITARKAAPAEREHLVAFFAAVGADKFAAAMATRPEMLPATSGNPGQPNPGEEDAEALGMRAATYRAAQAAKGVTITVTQAVMHCQANPEAGK